jgi:peptidoglycan/xylan/chitin deacetylase (PgdA/CDA1 family)
VKTLAVLAYHKIGEPSGDPKNWWYVREQVFEAHLELLRESGWSVLDLDTFLSGLAEPTALPERAVLLTFDDGYRSFRELALPLLETFGFPSVLFIPTGFVGGKNALGGWKPEAAISTWDDLRAVSGSGISVQAHSVSHRRFSELSLTEWRDEATRSKDELEERLGLPVRAFAYPYGDDAGASAELQRTLTEAGYRAAFLFGGGLVRLPVENPLRIPRLDVYPESDLAALLEGNSAGSATS